MNAEQDALAEVIAGHLPTGDDNIAEGLIGCSCGTPVRANFEGAGGYIAGLNQAMQIHVADALLAAGWTRRAETIDIVFDGPPSHESGRFVETENSIGQGVRVGEWVERPDGYWVLRIDRVVVQSPEPKPYAETTDVIERAGKASCQAVHPSRWEFAALANGPACDECMAAVRALAAAGLLGTRTGSEDIRVALSGFIAEQRDQYPRLANDMDSEELVDAILTEFTVTRRQA